MRHSVDQKVHMTLEEGPDYDLMHEYHSRLIVDLGFGINSFNHNHHLDFDIIAFMLYYPT